MNHASPSAVPRGHQIGLLLLRESVCSLPHCLKQAELCPCLHVRTEGQYYPHERGDKQQCEAPPETPAYCRMSVQCRLKDRRHKPASLAAADEAGLAPCCGAFCTCPLFGMAAKTGSEYAPGHRMASMRASSASTEAVGELASVECLYVWLLASSVTFKQNGTKHS